MSIDTDWEFKASHWEREAKRLIEENNSLKNELLLSEARQTMEAALSLPVSNTGEWQPIETAPKDGTAIWVATIFSGHGTGCMEPVRTHYHHYGEWTNIYTGNSINWKPTHWQPLPEAPK